MDVKPFRGVRPPRELAARVQGRAYDVMNSEEAAVECAGNPMSILHITRPEINFTPLIDEHEERVYLTARKQYDFFRQSGWLIRDSKPCYYVYAQTMEGRTQYGLVVTASVSDYREGRIKRHELTRKAKEDDRKRHIETIGAQIGPAFLVYRHQDELRKLIREVVKEEPEYDFLAPEDQTTHRLWVIRNDSDISRITSIFSNIPALYIADGHHRTAASARCGADYFLAVCFPDDELRILDYNRLVRDLNGLTPEELLSRLAEDFEIENETLRYEDENENETLDANRHRPRGLHEFALYMAGKWYRLNLRSGRCNEKDPIGRLDTDICSRLILARQLGITDLRTDPRVDFVGGLRGLGELERRVDSGEMALAIALYPVSMTQIMDIADSGNIMPPKSTWFEPKLRSGLVINEYAS